MAEVVRIHNGTGFFVAVMGQPGRVWTPYVTLEGFPVRRRRIRNVKVAKATRPCMKGKNPYPLKRAANQMLRVGRQQGITKSARRLLMEAKA